MVSKHDKETALTEAGSEIAYQEMEKLLSQQLESIERLNDRAITLSEFNLAIASIIAAGFKIADLQSGLVANNVLIWLIFGIGAFVISIYICMRVYTPKKYIRGVSIEETKLHDIFLTANKKVARAAVAKTYAQGLRENKPILTNRIRWFKWAVYSSYLGIVFILGAVIRPAFPSLPLLHDIGVAVIVTAIFIFLHLILGDEKK